MLHTVLHVTYLNIGVDDLQTLESYNAQTQSWGQAHHQVCRPRPHPPP